MRKERTDKQFVLDPGEWPRWPLLPMKRNASALDHPDDFCGFIAAEPSPPFKVYIGSIFGLKSGRLSEVVKGLKVFEYANADDLLAAWRID